MNVKALEVVIGCLKIACPIDFSMGYIKDYYKKQGSILAQCVIPITGRKLSRWVNGSTGAFMTDAWKKEILDIEWRSDEDEYIFSWKWQYLDNSIDGAIQRVQDVINGKDISEVVEMLKNFRNPNEKFGENG